MKSNELISVLLPTYNVADYIDEAVQSILSQTYTNIELIIVDDCSTDETYAKLEQIAASDKRIVLMKNESNRRIVFSLNRALSIARGSYIARMDGDDISVPARLEKMKEDLDCNPTCGIVGSLSAAIDSEGRLIAEHPLPISDEAIKKTLKWCSTVQHIWLARKEVYEKLGTYREFSGAEDYDFLLRAAKADYGLANYPECLYFVRLRQGNTESVEGLKRILVKKYVSKLHGNENGSLGLSLSDYITQKNTPAAAKRYRHASNLLNEAKHSRANKYRLVLLSLRAALSSRYMFEYLIETVAVRAVVHIDAKKRSTSEN